MKIFFRLLVFFLTMPVVELTLLLLMSRHVGLLWTILLILVTGLAGSYLAKQEGLSAWSRLQSRLGEGGLPGKELLDGVIILIAGALLITPGVLTDLIGFVGLIPLTRGWVRKLVLKRLKKAAREGRIDATFGAFGGSAWSPPGDVGGGMDGGMEGAAPGEAAPGEDAAAPPQLGGTPAARGPTPETSDPEPNNGAPSSSAPSSSAPSSGATGDDAQTNGTRGPEQGRTQAEASALDPEDEAAERT